MGVFANNAERKVLEQKMKQEGRLPPGQSLTLKWPVLHYGSVPRFDPQTWDFRTFGLVENPVRLTWREFLGLPKIQVTADFHCVTRWSRFDNRGEGCPSPDPARPSTGQFSALGCSRAFISIWERGWSAFRGAL